MNFILRTDGTSTGMNHKTPPNKIEFSNQRTEPKVHNVSESEIL